jgi:hypothetical protein
MLHDDAASYTRLTLLSTCIACGIVFLSRFGSSCLSLSPSSFLLLRAPLTAGREGEGEGEEVQAARPAVRRESSAGTEEMEELG